MVCLKSDTDNYMLTSTSESVARESITASAAEAPFRVSAPCITVAGVCTVTALVDI